MSEIYLFGDSITWGSWDPDRGGWAQQLRVEIDRIQLQHPELWCPLYNLGIPGDTAAGISKRIENEIQARHQSSQEVIVVVAVGINDSIVELPSGVGLVALEEFSKSLAEIVKSARKFSQKIGFVGLTPVDEALVNPVPWATNRAYTIQRAELFNSAIINFCAVHSVPYIPLWESWSKAPWRGLLYDGLHPNSEGHRLIYRDVRSLVMHHFAACGAKAVEP
jgi:lysophospholipase L1-like esterase